MQTSEIIKLMLLVVEMSMPMAIGFFILTTDFKNKKYLGFFFVIYGFSFLMEILNFFKFPVPNIVYFSLSFLHTSFLYSYINLLLIYDNKKTQKKVILFGIISSIIGFILLAGTLYNLPLVVCKVYETLSTFYFLFIHIVCIIQIIKHDKLIKEQYSDVNGRELKHYFVLFVFAILFLIVLAPILKFSLKEPYFTMFVAVGNTVWVLGITYVSLHHLVSKNLFEEPLPTIPLKEEKEKIKQEEEQNEELFEEISHTIKANELFLNTDLTIMEVALAVNRHPKLVSKTINLNTDVNFNSFINDFRVEYAKILLKNPKYQHIKIDEIGKMAGFHSKSVFYSNFKRVLKITPLQFQKN